MVDILSILSEELVIFRIDTYIYGSPTARTLLIFHGIQPRLMTSTYGGVNSGLLYEPHGRWSCKTHESDFTISGLFRIQAKKRKSQPKLSPNDKVMNYDKNTNHKIPSKEHS